MVFGAVVNFYFYLGICVAPEYLDRAIVGMAYSDFAGIFQDTTACTNRSCQEYIGDFLGAFSLQGSQKVPIRSPEAPYKVPRSSPVIRGKIRRDLLPGAAQKMVATLCAKHKYPQWGRFWSSG